MIIDKQRQEFDAIQTSLKEKILQVNRIEPGKIKTIAGIDIAYFEKDGVEYGVCCAVVIDCRTKEVLENKFVSGRIEVAYQPGYLAFREIPLVEKVNELLEIKPDLYMFDGNGYLHPKHMGLATHASFLLNRPTIGVAKTYYKIFDQDYTEPAPEAGSFTDISIGGEVYGCALRTVCGVKPVFVSVGNRIDLASCRKVVMDTVDSRSRIPLPTRLADIETRKQRKELLQSLETAENSKQQENNGKQEEQLMNQNRMDLNQAVNVPKSEKEPRSENEFRSEKAPETDEEPKIETIYVKLHFYPGARKTLPNLTGRWYRPHLVVKGQQAYLGVTFLDGSAEEASFDKDCYAMAELVYPGVDYSALIPGAEFLVMEGGKTVGEGVVLE